MQKFIKDANAGISDVEYYILKRDPEKRERLQKIRLTVKELFPQSTERIYFGFPTVDLDGKVLLQYPAYKKHISLIVGSGFAAYLKEKYPQYDYTDYTVFFPDIKPFPEEFIKEICGMTDKVERVIKPF